MKVKKLIKKLKKLDPEAIVLVQDGSYASEFCMVSDVRPGYKPNTIELDGWDVYVENPKH